MRSHREQVDFEGLLLADADVTRVLPPAEIRRAFDLSEQLRHVDTIFARVFGPGPSARGAEVAGAATAR
jgi:adenylosuccinate lyase